MLQDSFKVDAQYCLGFMGVLGLVFAIRTTDFHKEYHHDLRPFWCQGNYVDNISLRHTKSFLNNIFCLYN